MDPVSLRFLAKNAPLSLRLFRPGGRLMTGAAVGAAAAISAAAGLAALFIPPQDKPGCGGEEDESENHKYVDHGVTPSP